MNQSQIQTAKMKKQEYNKRYYQKKKNEEFLKAFKLIESAWYTIISPENLDYHLARVRNLRRTVIMLSLLVIILSVVNLFLH